MKNTSSFNTQKASPKLNATTALVLIVAMLPVLLFAMTKMFPPAVDTASGKTSEMSEAEARRVSAAERRAERAEARKAKKAEKAATARVQYGMAPDPGMASFPAPMEPMEFGGFGGGFGPGMGGFDNGMAMGPGMGGFGGPGMGFGGGFGGPGVF
ncbi:MAG: hypothetical protein IKP09_00740 [Lentisphaeria bacterium]|nr:hypothetical protein [Lentisphaeria bacterium]